MVPCESKHVGMFPEDNPLWIETCKISRIMVPCESKHVGMFPEDNPLWIETCKISRIMVPCGSKHVGIFPEDDPLESETCTKISRIMVPCGLKHVGILSALLYYKYLMNNNVNFLVECFELYFDIARNEQYKEAINEQKIFHVS